MIGVFETLPGGKMELPVPVGDQLIGGKGPLFLIAGPCVIESEEITLEVADFLRETKDLLNIPIIFKTSFDKANRTSLDSYRGPGIDRGLEILHKVKERTGLPVLSDIHEVREVAKAAQVLDVLQIPAFLCRQTDLLVAAAQTGLALNVKKGQFLSPWDMGQVIGKVTSTGHRRLLLTERGTTFGYNNLIVDIRSIAIMKNFGFPVVFDATHSVQLPGGAGSSSGGQREFVGCLSRAAVAAGADGVFMEVHPHPDSALCDGPNSIPLGQVRPLLSLLQEIKDLVSGE
jgi:2-dehydro-3-deoxyphosphooctonate aldolase (KDO 8-P synthase)